MLFLDTSALLKRYVLEEGSALVLELMARDELWTASALAQAETVVALCHLGWPNESFFVDLYNATGPDGPARVDDPTGRGKIRD